MLYIDGMEGVIKHSDTVRWLYSLIASSVSVPFIYLWLLQLTTTVAWVIFSTTRNPSRKIYFIQDLTCERFFARLLQLFSDLTSFEARKSD